MAKLGKPLPAGLQPPFRLALCGPAPLRSFKTLARYRLEGLGHTDARVRLTSEILQGVRIVKMQALEVKRYPQGPPAAQAQAWERPMRRC